MPARSAIPKLALNFASGGKSPTVTTSSCFTLFVLAKRLTSYKPEIFAGHLTV